MVGTAERLGTLEAEQKLNRWNKLIREQEKEKAVHHKKELDLWITETRDPLVKITYHMLQIRFYLLFKDTSGVLDGFSAVGSPRDLPGNRLKYYYYFFNGILLYDCNHYNEAVESFLTAKPFLKELKDAGETAEFKYKLSVVYHKANYLLLSIYTAEEALRIFRKQGNLKRCADCENVLAVNTKYIKQYKESESHFHKALKLAEEVGDRKRLGVFYKNLGALYAEQNLPESALNCLKKAYHYISFGEYKGQRVRNVYLLAHEYFKIYQTDEGLKWMEEGMKLSLDQEDGEYSHRFKMLKAKYQDHALFEQTYKEGIAYLKEHDLWEYLCEYSEELAAYYRRKAQLEYAVKYYDLAIEARKIFKKKGALIP